MTCLKAHCTHCQWRVIPDKQMMFGRGELEVYRYAGADYPDNPAMSALEFSKRLKTGEDID